MRRPRNPVVQKMITRRQNAGYHASKKIKQSKYLAREVIDEDEIGPPFHERELPHICIYPDCFQEVEYISPGDLCSEHWHQWWNNGLEEMNKQFWEKLLGRDND